MDTIVVVILTFLAVFIFIAVLAYVVFINEKKRTAKIKLFARNRSFLFKGEIGDFSHSYDHALFSIGRSKKKYNVFEGRKDSYNFVFMDYKYTVGSGKHSNTYNQSVLIVNLADIRINLPNFILGPEGFLHKIGNLFGFNDIDFKLNKVFSDKFILKGEDEARIRSVFDMDILKFFENKSNDFNIEVNENILIYYKLNKRIDVDTEFDSFYSEFNDIIETFK